MDYAYLKKVRSAELELALRFFPQNARILEIGAGTGWQAKILSERGFEVDAVDLANYSPYKSQRVFPIQEYDGTHLPFEDGRFDLVYSSNVLEHIEKIEQFHLEMQRVLKPACKCVHIVPSDAWKRYCFITHFPAILKEAYLAFVKPAPTTDTSAHHVSKPARPLLETLRRVAYPIRHGEHGSTLDELKLFQPTTWIKQFTQANWKNIELHPTNLAYSGYALFGSRISLRTRNIISNYLGSSTLIVTATKP